MKAHYTRTVLFFIALVVFSQQVYSFKPGREYYQIKIYHLKDKDQEARLDQYLQNAYLPALHRKGMKSVGVFKPLDNDTSSDRRLYVFFPLQSLDQLLNLSLQLEKDKEYTQAAGDYANALYTSPPYVRMESIVLYAFPEAPKMKQPALKSAHSERVYELRSYESATEKLHANKVKMFNEGGEVRIFSNLDFNPVFYAQVISGSHMPNLMYLTTFENMAQRDEHWKAFSADTAWKALSAMPEYKNNVSKSEKFFLRPTDYSDL